MALTIFFCLVTGGIAFFIGWVVSESRLQTRQNLEKLSEAVSRSESIYEEANKDRKGNRPYIPHVTDETVAEILGILLNPHECPVIDTGSKDNVNAQYIGWLLDQVKKDPKKWYDSYVIKR